MALVLRRLFNLLVALSFLLCVCAATLWWRQLHQYIPPSREPLERGASTTDRAVEAQLDRTLPQIDFDHVGLKDTLDFMTDVSGSTVDVNWKAIESDGIRPDTPVTLSLSGVRCSAAFARILDTFGLAYTTDGPVICISTRTDLRRVGHQARALRWPDIEDSPPTSPSTWIESPALSISESFAAFQKQMGIPVDVKWDALRPVGIAPETPVRMVSSAPARQWLGIICRHMSIDHEIQFEVHDTRIVVAPREWFDRAKRPGRLFLGAALLVLAAVWSAGMWRVRRGRALSPFLIATLLVLSAGAGAWVCQTHSTMFHGSIGSRRWTLDASLPALMSLNVKPLFIPLYPGDTSVSGVKTVAWRRGPFMARRFGPPLRETMLMTTSWAVVGLLLILPAFWAVLRGRVAARVSYRRRRGQCPNCGYDLRSSPERCPECGGKRE